MTDTPRDERDPLGLLPEFHRTTRMPLDAVVRLHFEGTVAYQNGFAANVSALGMFVKHPDPPEVGTRLVFEFVLGDERKPVQGGGVVTWVRERYEGPGRPAGVGIQFTELDALSRQHIAESLFEYLETQLGVEVADHPDVPNLLAAMPRTTRFDVPDDEANEPGAPQGELSFAADAAAVDAAAAPAEPQPSFRLFGDEAERAGMADDELLAEAGTDLFAPIAPPEDFAPYQEEARFGAAKRQGSPRWLPIAIVAALVAGGLVAWWFVSGPGAEPSSAPIATAADGVPPAPLERPRLDPQPGPATTLAESVGAESAAVEPPAAADPGVVPTSPEPAPAPTVETDDDANQPAAVREATPAPTSGERFRKVSDITWETFDGGTDVTLTGDGIFPAGSFRWFEMRDERPRVLLRLTGVSAAFPRTAIPVATAELVSVRSGYHEKPAGNELHIVLDLASPDVRVDWVDAVSNRLVVRLSQP